MGKLGQLHAVLLAEQCFIVSALPNIVYLNRLIALGGHTQLARIVEINGEDMWCLAILEIVSLEELIGQSQRCVAAELRRLPVLYCRSYLSWPEVRDRLADWRSRIDVRSQSPRDVQLRSVSW